MSSPPTLAPDAAMVLGIASTAMPFARTPEAEVERWLRVLRMHGQAGIALQALGFSEEQLVASIERPDAAHPDRAKADATTAPADPDAVARVTEAAVRAGAERGASVLTTTDLLVAVMHVYGGDFDRALRVHGTDRDEVLERLGLDAPALNGD
jgi:ATP-dependent Clp protease ATP-binding subunit ClpA